MKKYIQSHAVKYIIIVLVIFIVAFKADTPPAGVSVAVIVNIENPVASLSISEAKLYFLRKVKKRWPEINKNIKPAGRKAQCAESELFYSKVLNMSMAEVDNFFLEKQYQNAEKPLDKFSSDKDILEFVGNEVGGIGYVNSGAITGEAKSKVKIVLTIN